MSATPTPTRHAHAKVRPAAVAGRFYSDHPAQLRQTIGQLLQEAATRQSLPMVNEVTSSAQAPSPSVANQTNWPKAVIVPHAGYVYSGPIAASAYVRLRPARGQVTRVVLLGPSHHVPVSGLAVSTMDAFATPLGEVALDTQAIADVLSLPQVVALDAAHEMEHSLEVQLPWLSEVLGDFRLVPLAVGDARPAEVAQVIERLWGGTETIFIVSSDLSHYHRYQESQRLDQLTSTIIERGSVEHLLPDQACGAVPIRGLLVAAQSHHLQAHTIDLRNSGDTAGSRDRVVGYGAFIFEPVASASSASSVLVSPSPVSIHHPAQAVIATAAAPETDATAGHAVDPLLDEQGQLRLLSEDRRMLVQLAHQAIAHRLREGRLLGVDVTSFPAVLQKVRATFVTLKMHSQLRGCIGTLQAREALVADVVRHADAAAFSDPRFPPVTWPELHALEVHISILSPALPMQVRDEADLLAQLRPGCDGLILEESGARARRATFLPAVWENLPDARQFLQHLKAKAGLPADYWSDKLRFARYTAQAVE